MITITRRLAAQLRAVFRRAFNFRGIGPAVAIIGDKAGLTVRSVHGDVALEYRAAGHYSTETLWLPFEFLNDCQGKKDDCVELDSSDKKQVTARWQDGRVPQIVNYAAPQPCAAIESPEALVENPPELLAALQQASAVTDPDSLRYATGCVQLSPDGTITATDGRQIFFQSGFTFPWQSAILVPRSKIFSSPVLPQGKAVDVGEKGDWFIVRTGPWSIYLRVNKEGKFPSVSRYLTEPAAANTRCSLSDSDRSFLLDTLPKLPCDDATNNPVTIELSGRVLIRARAADTTQPTEVVLSNSTSSGETIRVNTNRQYLAHALALGLKDLCVYGDSSPIVCFDATRKYVWAVLSPEDAVKSADNAIRIESPKADSVEPIPAAKRKTSAMSETITQAATDGQSEAPKPAHHKAKQQDVAALIDQAIEFRSVLHGLVQQSNALVKALKQHRRQSKAVQQTLASLRQLKSLGV